MLAKDPVDRFQTGLDLVEEIEGRPAAPRRISGASTRERLAAMPTTPIPAVTVDATGTRPARTSGPSRPAMQRSAAPAGPQGAEESAGVDTAAGRPRRRRRLRCRETWLWTHGRAPRRRIRPRRPCTAGRRRPGGHDAARQHECRQLPRPTPRGPTLTRLDSAELPRLPASPPRAPPPHRALRLPANSGAAEGLDGHGGRRGARCRDPDQAVAGAARRRHLGAAACLLRGHVNIRSGLELTFTPDLTPVGEPLRPRRRAAQGLGPVDTTRGQLRAAGPGLQQGPGLLGHPGRARSRRPGCRCRPR